MILQLNPRKPLKENTTAIAVMYDTLLFLAFVSLAGVILLPAIIPSNISTTSKHIRYDTISEETLHIVMTSTIPEFNYTMGKRMIDMFAHSLGINTTQQNGLYQTLIQWILGKQQQHKAIREHIAELLYCQLRFPLSENETINLNILTSDYEQQLKKHLYTTLNHTIPENFHYHLIATWEPVKNCSIGGTFELGYPPPPINCYPASQTIAMPFLPIFTINDTLIVFSEQWVLYQLESLKHNISQLQNLSNLYDQKNTTNTTLDQIQTIVKHQKENLSSLFLDLLGKGLYNDQQQCIFPGVLSLIINDYLHSLFETDMFSSLPFYENQIGYGYSSIDTFFSTINTSSSNQFASFLRQQIMHLIQDQLSDILFEGENLTSSIQNQIITSIEPLLEPILMDLMSSLKIDDLLQIHPFHLLEHFIKHLFSKLSLTQARITLTLWEASMS